MSSGASAGPEGVKERRKEGLGVFKGMRLFVGVARVEIFFGR